MNDRVKRPVGRPTNTELMEKVISMLQAEPRTIKSIAEELDMPKRTAYRYVELAEKAGMTVVKVGFSKESPYRILDKPLQV